jgi:hypothetical protein
MLDKKNAAWFLMTLMLLLSVLMIFHLLTLWVGVAVCRDYGAALLQRVVADPAYRIAAPSNTCATLESTLSEAVDKYLSVILSLIGGAAVSGGVAASNQRRDDEE